MGPLDLPAAPAELTVDRRPSGPNQTKLDVDIHGFWAAHRMGPDQRMYTHIRVPVGSTNQVGPPICRP